MKALIKIAIGAMVVAMANIATAGTEFRIQGSYDSYRHGHPPRHYYPADPRVPPPRDYYPGQRVYPNHGHRPYYGPRPGYDRPQRCFQATRFEYDSYGRLVIVYETVCH